jgi:hypothetical protein
MSRPKKKRVGEYEEVAAYFYISTVSRTSHQRRKGSVVVEDYTVD